MVLGASKRIGLSALLLGLTLLVVLFSQWHGAVKLTVPNFTHLKQSLVAMMTVGVMLAAGTACMGITLGIISLFVPSTYKRKKKEASET